MLTIAIISQNRPRLLTLCLDSLAHQTIPPPPILLIENNLKKTYSSVVAQFPQLQITYLLEKKPGRPHARNLALNRCRTPYLAFIDDDCQPDSKWTVTALHTIKKHPLKPFIIGRSIDTFPEYQPWFSRHLRRQHYDSRGLDTKNVILNLNLLSSFRFDPHFAIFEDADFGQQIVSSYPHGYYQPKLIVRHRQKSSSQKNFHRGQYKFLFHQKWGNFDHYYPHLLTTNHHQLFFSLGYLWAKYHPLSHQLITIVNSLDKSANEARAKSIFRFLYDRGYNIRLFDAQAEFDSIVNHPLNICRYPLFFSLYRLCRLLIFKFRLPLNSYLTYFKFCLRGQITPNFLKQTRTKIAIIQHPDDLFAFPSSSCPIIYDSPTIYSQEAALLPISAWLKNKIKTAEILAFKKSAYVCFHWYRYLQHALDCHLPLRRTFILNWGCTSVPHPGKHHQNKIVYLGNLSSPWIDLPSLKHFSRTSPLPVDIYSYENNPPLPTLGFLSDLNQLGDYRFGLITQINHPHRNHGFCAKHLLYLSYGLPVLCPEWLRDPLLSPATIYYNQKNFLKIIQKYSQSKLWRRKHLAALKLANKLSWDKTLPPLLPIIDTLLL